MATQKRSSKRYAADPEARKAQLADIHQQLTGKIEALTSGAEWQAMLRTAAKFHNYSLNNLLLIMMQSPEASQVAGFQRWRSMGRFVRKGEKGIKVLAPMVGKEDKGDPDSPSRVFGFKIEHVFDISQTDGEELPDIAPKQLDGNGPEGMYDALLSAANSAGFTVKREYAPGHPDAYGMMIRPELAIYVRPDIDEAQACKTLAHEIAHAELGHATPECHNVRSLGEVEAESVAYMISESWGLDTSGYSLPYIGGWAKDGEETETVKQTAQRVIKAAHAIIERAA